MSDNVSLNYSNREVLKLVMGNTNNLEPVHPYQLHWMAHWTQANGSAPLRAHKRCVGTNDTKDQTEHCCLPVETMKQTYSYECKNSWTCKQDQISYVLQSIEDQGDNDRRFKILNNSVVEHNLHSSRPEATKKLPNCKNCSSYHFQNSNSLVSEWPHFPMFDINRKLETLMAPRKRTRSPNIKLFPHLTELANEGHYHPEQYRAQTDEEVPYYNGHKPDMTSSMEHDEENDHFCSGLAYKEHFANANISYLKHELCNCSKQSTIMASVKKPGDLRCVGSSWNKLQGGSSCCPEDVPCPLLQKVRNKERQNICDRNGTSLEVSRSNKMLCSSMGRRKDECGTHSSGTQHMLIRKEMGMDLCHKNQIIEDSIASANTKGTAFFEKLTFPAVSYFHDDHEGNSQALMRLPSNNLEDVGRIDTKFMMTENVPLLKTDIMHIDVNETPSCHEVGSSAQSQKDDVPLNLRSSDMVDEDSSHFQLAGILQRNEEDAKMKEVSTKPSSLAESKPDSEPSWKWVKRLRSNPLDPTPLGSKRFKTGDTSTGEMQNLLARVLNYNRSISDLPDHRQLGKIGECSPGDSAKVIPWIRRWCKSSQKTTSPTPVLCEPENSRVPSEKFEAKQFPSLAAMALMGKQVTNFRPCEFRRSGSTVVWKI